MRSRVAAILLGAIMVMGLAGCKKKEEAAQAPPASTDQQAQQAPAATPPAQTAQPAARTAGCGSSRLRHRQKHQRLRQRQPLSPKQAPPPPPPPIVIPAGTTVTVRMGEHAFVQDRPGRPDLHRHFGQWNRCQRQGCGSCRLGRYRSRFRSQVGWQVQGRGHPCHPADFHQRQGCTA